jgi:hypothetical protein
MTSSKVYKFGIFRAHSPLLRNGTYSSMGTCKGQPAPAPWFTCFAEAPDMGLGVLFGEGVIDGRLDACDARTQCVTQGA